MVVTESWLQRKWTQQGGALSKNILHSTGAPPSLAAIH